MKRSCIGRVRIFCWGVHIDFAELFEGKQFLVAVDAFSKWPEVVIMEDMSTDRTLDELRVMFARWGILQQIVSDNGSHTVHGG